MINKYFLIVFFIFNINSLEANFILPDSSTNNWQVLHEDKIWVGWINEQGIDWCRTKAILDAPILKVKELIENKADYPKVFKRIEKTKIINDEIVYISLDLPFPFYGRDYVVKYVYRKEGSDLLYSFHSIIHDEVPIVDGYIRLLNAMGEWRIKPLDFNQTEITYTWNGELSGDFPDWALPKAWKQQGIEIIDWLDDALE